MPGDHRAAKLRSQGFMEAVRINRRRFDDGRERPAVMPARGDVPSTGTTPARGVMARDEFRREHWYIDLALVGTAICAGDRRIMAAGIT